MKRWAPGIVVLLLTTPATGQTLAQDRDAQAQGGSLPQRPVASVSGRVIAEAGTQVSSLLSLRVAAEPVGGEEPTANRSWRQVIYGFVDDADSFRMTGFSGGLYRFSVRADRPPFLVATRISVNGIEVPAASGVEVPNGANVVVFAARRPPPPVMVDKTIPSASLVEQFQREKVFFRQFEIAQAIVERRDTSVLSELVGGLNHEDRHLRGNAAFIFAGLGDARGFPILMDMLADRSDRPPGQGVAVVGGNGVYEVTRQIAADRSYAAHLLGDLRDARAVPTLLALTTDPEISAIVPWSLGQIGDKRAVRPLIDELQRDDPSMRVHVIYALETLQAKEALPRLMELLNDHRRSTFGNTVSVADAAKIAISKLQ